MSTITSSTATQQPPPSSSSTTRQAPSSTAPSTVTTTNAQNATEGTNNSPPPALQQTLPSADQQRYVTEARAAVVASIENMMDSELQWRASTLHANADVLKKQAADVQRATDGLRREREKLVRAADQAGRRIKELGNVQNWAEVLERDFLVLEETVRLARRGSCSCSCSECGGSFSGSGSEDGDEGDGGERMQGVVDGKGLDSDALRGIKMQGKEGMVLDGDADQGVVTGTWSDASRSVTDPASSTGRAKSNDTASVSTTG